MADDKPKMVTVEALEYHTNAGHAYQVGDTYEVEESAVDNLAHLGFAVRVDRVEVAKASAKAAEKQQAAAAKEATLQNKRMRSSPKARNAKKR